jgi:hypothetical protein
VGVSTGAQEAASKVDSLEPLMYIHVALGEIAGAEAGERREDDGVHRHLPPVPDTVD